MPHIEIKCYPGRTEEQKTEAAKQLAEAAAEILGCREGAISISIKDVPAEEWKEQVWDKEIVAEDNCIYKKPGYEM